MRELERREKAANDGEAALSKVYLKMVCVCTRRKPKLKYYSLKETIRNFQPILRSCWFKGVKRTTTFELGPVLSESASAVIHNRQAAK